MVDKIIQGVLLEEYIPSKEMVQYVANQLIKLGHVVDKPRLLKIGSIWAGVIKWALKRPDPDGLAWIMALNEYAQYPAHDFFNYTVRNRNGTITPLRTDKIVVMEFQNTEGDHILQEDSHYFSILDEMVAAGGPLAGSEPFRRNEDMFRLIIDLISDWLQVFANISQFFPQMKFIEEEGDDIILWRDSNGVRYAPFSALEIKREKELICGGCGELLPCVKQSPISSQYLCCECRITLKDGVSGAPECSHMECAKDYCPHAQARYFENDEEELPF